MVVAPIFMYLVALIGLLFMAAGGFDATTLVLGVLLIWILERELFQVRRFSEGDDASDEPHHLPR
jgi:hypothetical protein